MCLCANMYVNVCVWPTSQSVPFVLERFLDILYTENSYKLTDVKPLTTSIPSIFFFFSTVEN